METTSAQSRPSLEDYREDDKLKEYLNFLLPVCQRPLSQELGSKLEGRSFDRILIRTLCKKHNFPNEEFPSAIFNQTSF